VAFSTKEMPKGVEPGRMHGFQLWAKLPSSLKMTDPHYLDVSVPPGREKRLKVETTSNAFAYVFAGSGTFREASERRAVLTEQVAKPDAPPDYDISNHLLVLFDRGDGIVVHASDEGIRFLLVSGKPDRAARGLLRSDRDEHARVAPTSCRRTTARQLHKAPLNQCCGRKARHQTWHLRACPFSRCVTWRPVVPPQRRRLIMRPPLFRRG